MEESDIPWQTVLVLSVHLSNVSDVDKKSVCDHGQKTEMLRRWFIDDHAHQHQTNKGGGAKTEDDPRSVWDTDDQGTCDWLGRQVWSLTQFFLVFLRPSKDTPDR